MTQFFMFLYYLYKYMWSMITYTISVVLNLHDIVWKYYVCFTSESAFTVYIIISSIPVTLQGLASYFDIILLK